MAALTTYGAPAPRKVPMSGITRRERLESRHEALKRLREPYMAVWRDVAEHFAPYRFLLSLHDKNNGRRRDHKILNSRPVMALNTLAAGMMARITSPAREWFKLGAVDPDRDADLAVRRYVEMRERLAASALQNSAFYKALSSAIYRDMAAFGTGAMLFEASPVGELQFRPMVIGEFCLDIDAEGRVDTCSREFTMTVRQVVQKFGLAKCSPRVREAWDRGNYETEVVICHEVFPNEEYEAGAVGRHGKRWASCWYEHGDRTVPFLRESGYDRFPVLAPRWDASPSEIYGHGPGVIAVGDCKALQHHERGSIEMLDLIKEPPLQGDADIHGASLLPRSLVRLPKGEHRAPLSPVYLPDYRALTEVRAEIGRIEDRISEVMHSMLWRLFIDDDRAQRATAAEVEAKRQEAAFLLGPLLESMNNDLLEPAVEGTLAIQDEFDGPLAPEGIEDAGGIKIEFVSIMHQAQQATKLTSHVTLIEEIKRIAAIRPDVLDKVNADAAVDTLVRITGASSAMVHSKDEVDAVRQQRAMQEQAERQGQAMLAATQGAKNLSGVDAGKLQELASTIVPAAAAQGGGLGPAT